MTKLPSWTAVVVAVLTLIGVLALIAAAFYGYYVILSHYVWQ